MTVMPAWPLVGLGGCAVVAVAAVQLRVLCCVIAAPKVRWACLLQFTLCLH